MIRDLKHLRTVAESWVGTPFRADCMVKGAHGGIDCKLLAVAVVGEWLGLPAADPERFAKKRLRFVDDGVVLSALEHYFCHRHELYYPLTELGPLTFRSGDILGFRRGNLGHVAVMLDLQACVHVSMRTGVVIMRIEEMLHRMKLQYVYRLREAANG